MLNSQALQKIEVLAQQVAKQEGCRLYDVEFVGAAKNRTLRVYIDNPGSGMDVDQCALFSHGLSLLLDVEDVVPGDEYSLEISSPGLERRLTKDWHFEEVVGKKIKIKSKSPFELIEGEYKPKNKPKHMTGLLKALEINENNKNIIIEAENRVWSLDIDELFSARVIFELKSQKKTSPNKAGKKESQKNKGKKRS